MDRRYVTIGRRGDGAWSSGEGQPQTKRRAAVTLSAGLVLKAIRVAPSCLCGVSHACPPCRSVGMDGGYVRSGRKPYPTLGVTLLESETWRTPRHTKRT